MSDNTTRQDLIDALGRHLPPGSYTVDSRTAGLTILWLLPEGTEKLAAILAGAGKDPAAEDAH